MGALTVVLGLPRLILHPQLYFPRLPHLKSHTHLHQISHSLRKNSHSNQSQRIRRLRPVSAASVSWPSESWGRPQEGENEEGVRENRALEGATAGLGVAVAMAVLFSKQRVSAGILSLSILTASAVAFRQHLAGVLCVLVAQFNSVQAALAVRLSSVRRSVIDWGTTNGANASTPSAPIESASFAGVQEHRHEDVNSTAGSKELSSAEIEAALSHIAKSVAQLTMVVAGLDNKISSLENDVSNNLSNSRTPTIEQNNKIAEDDGTQGSALTGMEERQRGTYRIQNSQVKWEDAFFKDRRGNQVNPQGSESPQDSRTSNVVDVFSASEYDNNALASTILYDSRGDRVLLLDSRPVDVTFEVGRFNQPASPKFSKAPNARDSPMEFFFQDVGAKEALQEDAVSQTGDEIQSKQDTAAVELLFQEAGFKAPEAEGDFSVQSTAKFGESSTAKNPEEKVARGASLSREAQNNDVFRDQGRVSNGAGAQRKQTSRASRPNLNELSGSEGYRAVPTSPRTASKPDALRLKRIMNGTEPSAVFADESKQPNAWTQKEASGSGMRKANVLYQENPAFEVGVSESREAYPVSGKVGPIDRPDEYGGVHDSVGVGRESARPLSVLSYDEQERGPRGRPRPEGSEGTKSSGTSDYGQRWPREGSADATGSDFGGNGSSSDTNEGRSGNKRRQGSSGSAGNTNASNRDVEPPTSQERRPSRAGPSYPSEGTESFRNLPEPKPDDEGFRKIIDEVEALLREGREGLEGRIEVGVAERMLYEAAELCEKAAGVKPSSLVAVGLWGNTLLLHGELKLRLSQNLRNMLPEPPPKSFLRQESKEAEKQRLRLESTLQDVGEECEQLLVEAGRKYRLALSMDRTDMRALYNWGLALCYRGQLIAEEGGETAAQDADKVFLAAIDKFEAMIGLSDSYAAGALLNWGLAMRDRSRLRPLGSKERQRILGQAKEIFQEALRVDPNYGQARGAVAACGVEMKRLQEYEEEEPKKSKDSSTSRGFRDWWG